jgi:hypothetical protein
MGMSMRRTSSLGATLAVAAAVAALLAPAVGAAPAQCSGFVTGAVDGNLVVPDGAWCILAGAQVHGNVLVGTGAWLHAVSAADGSPTTIDGNVAGTNVKWVLLQDRTQVGGNFVVDGASTYYTGFDIDVRVGGNATITGNAGYTFVDAAIVGRNVDVQGGTGGVEVEWNRVGGNESVANNVPTTLSVYGNQVAGNLAVAGNTCGGPKQVIDNTAGRNLTCVGNDDPFVSSGNGAQHIQGQCS